LRPNSIVRIEVEKISIDDTKQLIVLECKRVIEIIESGTKLSPWNNSAMPELKAKMHELRRDTIRLENQIYRPQEFDNGGRV